MKLNKTLIVALSLGLCVANTSCDNFDDLNTDPNATNKVTPEMIATGLLYGMTKQSYGYDSYIDHNFMSKHAMTAELIRSSLYNKISRSGFGAYIDLTQAQKMVEAATGDNKPAYEALAHFIKAYKGFYLSLTFGDVPYSDAANPEELNPTPKYDSQKDVMLGILNDLDKAEELFAKGYKFDGDIIYNGDPEKWTKAVNAFKLKVLINLYKHTDESELNVKSRFSSLVNGGKLMQSIDDNFQLVYSNKGGQVYPFNSLHARSHDYVILSSNLVDSLKAYNDYRLFYYAEPTEDAIAKGVSAGSFDAYSSVDPSLPFNEITDAYGKNICSKLNMRYRALDNPAGEPIVRIGYAEQCFNIAEGIVRGWMSGDAKKYYNMGVKAAMTFTQKNTPDRFVSGRPQITEDYLNEYLATGRGSFSGEKDIQLKQIAQQKYFIYFLQYPWEGYYEYRRVLYPNLPINPNTNMNTVPDMIPTRWMYPQLEYDVNGENLKEALDRQYNGKDDNNDLMWLLKN